MKKKGLIIIIAVLAVVAVVAIALTSSYNGFVDKEEAVKTAQSTISVQLQRRADLIPNFVSTAKGYSDYEQSTYTAVTEAYPELKADRLYIDLQTELAGTENRIAVARKDYNDAAGIYNKAVRRFPGSLLAGIFGFEQVEYFEADESANQVPQVSFD